MRESKTARIATPDVPIRRRTAHKEPPLMHGFGRRSVALALLLTVVPFALPVFLRDRF